MSRPLMLAAASGLAREVLSMVRAGNEYEVIGFVDDSPTLWGTRVDGVEVLGPLDTVPERPDVDLLLCAGSGSARAAMARRIDSLGVGRDRYVSLVHPAAAVAPGTSIGYGSIVLAGVVVTAAIAIGAHTVVMPNAVVTHDDSLGDFVTVCASVVLGGYVPVGDGAYLGAGSSIRERCAVGAWSTLGMGAVLVRDLPVGETWAGNPARLLRSRTGDEPPPLVAKSS